MTNLTGSLPRLYTLLASSRYKHTSVCAKALLVVSWLIGTLRGSIIRARVIVKRCRCERSNNRNVHTTQSLPRLRRAITRGMCHLTRNKNQGSTVSLERIWLRLLRYLVLHQICCWVSILTVNWIFGDPLLRLEHYGQRSLIDL